MDDIVTLKSISEKIKYQILVGNFKNKFIDPFGDPYYPNNRDLWNYQRISLMVTKYHTSRNYQKLINYNP